MRIWKKALSAGLTAMLLASLTATAVFAVKGASGTADRTDRLNCTAAADFSLTAGGASTCSQVADGISTVGLTGEGAALAGTSLYITATGASIIGVTALGDYVLAGGIVTAADLSNPTGDVITLRAPAVAGTATVSVYSIATATGIATPEGTMTITFTATTGLDVSVANSTVKTLATCAGLAKTSAPATIAASVAHLCVVLKNGNGGYIANGTVVDARITSVGTLTGTLTGQIVSQVVAGGAGLADFAINATGASGAAVIAVTVTVGAVTTTFTPVTFTFTGDLATLTVTQKKFAIAKSAVAAAQPGIATVAGKDATGNALDCDPTWVATSGTTTVIPSGTVAADCTVNVASFTPSTLGSSAVTVQTADASIKAAPFTMYVSDVAATVTVAFSAATVNPGGTATITVTAKDAGGRPVADASPTGLIVSAGAFTPLVPTTLNGMATATYLAPFNTGVVTALASVGGINGSGQTNVGAVVPVAGSGTNASALGATKTGTYTTATKIAALGKYQTWKISYGAGAAGQTVGILVATKNSAGVWSSFTRLTGRVADSAGDAYFWWYSPSAAWISVRGDLAGSLSNAVQGRWR